jgi:hypothetical protein
MKVEVTLTPQNPSAVVEVTDGNGEIRSTLCILLTASGEIILTSSNTRTSVLQHMSLCRRRDAGDWEFAEEEG